MTLRGLLPDGLPADAVLIALLVTGPLLGTGCAPRPSAPVAAQAVPQDPAAVSWVPLDPPAAAAAMAPNLVEDDGEIWLSWIEPGQEGGKHQAVRHARLQQDGGERRWSSPGTVVEGEDLFANWADFPSLQPARGGGVLAHWLQKSGAGTYAYDVQLAHSSDGGTSWSPLGPANNDGTETEHGFVSMVTEGDGVRVFWLDGRELKPEGADDGAGHGAGAMTLRTARVNGENGREPGGDIGRDEVLDERVCECCQTAATNTAGGAVVAYRNRDENEVRDIWIVRQTGSGWSAPAPVHVDGWEVPGCPVNGPAIAAAADGQRLAVAWFTAANNQPQVKVAFSGDAGVTFSPPVVVDAGMPLGRVDVVMDDKGDALVSWLEIRDGEDEAEILVRRISAGGSAGTALGEAITVAASSVARSSGFPRLAVQGSDLIAAWTESGETSRLRAAAHPLASISGPPARVSLDTAAAADAAGGTADRAEARAAADTARPWDRTDGSQAPGYSAVTLGGLEVSLAGLRGSPVLLNVWATWCMPCRAEMPVLEALRQEYVSRGLQVIGVSIDAAGAVDQMRAAAATAKAGYTLWHDPAGKATALFGLTSLPANYLFDADGVLVWSRVGPIHAEDAELASALAAVLSRQAFLP